MKATIQKCRKCRKEFETVWGMFCPACEAASPPPITKAEIEAKEAIRKAEEDARLAPKNLFHKTGSVPHTLGSTVGGGGLYKDERDSWDVWAAPSNATPRSIRVADEEGPEDE